MEVAAVAGMSTQSIPFESINLEPSVRKFKSPTAATDTSDDGLDPNDFLSQSRTAHRKNDDTEDSDVETSREKEALLLTSHEMLLNAATPTLSNSMNLSVSRDSLFFSFGNLRENGSSPLEHLLETQESLTNDMNTAIRLHEGYLAEGEDCSSARMTFSRLFAALSENCMLLQEVYIREGSKVGGTLARFQAWDKKRTRVLRRIKKIKSENNEYGAKLSVLLSRRTAVDSEIQALEARLSSLQSSKTALDKEVDGTMSVLESKSAKYVNMFRNLEQVGKDAVLDYLGSGGPFIRYESVNTMFIPETAAPRTDKRTDLRSVEAGDNEQKPISIASSPKLIGAQACEVPEVSDQLSGKISDQIPDDTAPIYTKSSSAYAKGYAKGLEQLSTVKKRLSALLLNVIPSPPQPPSESDAYTHLADSLNTITRKLDLQPIVDLLTSKSEALDDLVLYTAKASEKFHKQGLLWSEICTYLDTQEDRLLQLLARSLDVLGVESVLKEIYTYLSSKLEASRHQNILDLKDEEDYLQILLSQEIFTVATALDRISGKDAYVVSLRSSENFSTGPVKEVRSHKDLRYSITSISLQQDTSSYTASETPSRQPQKSPRLSARYPGKDVKNE